MIAQQYQLAKKKFFSDRPKHQYNLEHFYQLKNPQMKLF